MTEVSEVTPTPKINLKEFRSAINDFQRSCLFHVDCEQLPKFSFLAKSLKWSPGRYLELVVVEEEGLTAYDMLTEIRDKRYPLKLSFHEKTGGKSRTITVVPIEMDFNISMDWEDTNKGIAMWNVQIIL